MCPFFVVVDKIVELVCGGSIINGATASSLTYVTFETVLYMKAFPFSFTSLAKADVLLIGHGKIRRKAQAPDMLRAET